MSNGHAPIGFEMQNVPQSGIGFENIEQNLPLPQPEPYGSLYPKLQLPDSPQAESDDPPPGDAGEKTRGAVGPGRVAGPIGPGNIAETGGPGNVAQPDSPDKAACIAEVKDRLINILEEEETKRGYFKDGIRKIDYVFVYKPQEMIEEPEKERLRKDFEEQLVKIGGLKLEHVSAENSKDGETAFVKVYAPFDELVYYADRLGLDMPIKGEKQELRTSVLTKLKVSIKSKCLKLVEPPGIQPEEQVYVANFDKTNLDMFAIYDKETFFTNAQRTMLLYEELCNIKYDSGTKYGLQSLLKKEIYVAAFPLHEGHYKSEATAELPEPTTERQVLYNSWAHPKNFRFYQPLHVIKRYFGEKIGIYFAWLGFYTNMLLIATIAGLIVFIYGCATLGDNYPSREICNDAVVSRIVMCPLCDRQCSYWYLKTSCLYSKVVYLFDNTGTVFMAAFTAIWATLFLEFWKRHQIRIQYEWHMQDLGADETRNIRHEFETKCKRLHKKVRDDDEYYLPWYYKIYTRMTSCTVVLFLICCVLAAVFGVIAYRIIVASVIYVSDVDPFIRQNARTIASLTAPLLNLIVILILGRAYIRVARWLTDLELPKTNSDYEDSFTFKMFAFQFINYYASIFYIAFFKGRFNGYPAKYNYSLHFRAEECDPAGCLIELSIQLAVVMIGKQIFSNFLEVVLPWLKKKKVPTATLR